MAEQSVLRKPHYKARLDGYMRNQVNDLTRSETPQSYVRSLNALLEAANEVESIHAGTVLNNDTVERLANTSEWNHLMAHLVKSEDDETSEYLFRAHSTEEEMLRFSADEHRRFGTEFKSLVSVKSFAENLERHLGKTECPANTWLVSMSSNLQWTVHKAGQKHRKEEGNKRTRLLVVDLRGWRQSNIRGLFRVQTLLPYLDSRGYEVRNRKWRQWAENCDEYIAIGQIPAHFVVHQATWEDIYCSGFLPSTFYWSYTLAVLRRDFQTVDESADTLKKKILEFVNTVAGENQPLRKWVNAYLSRTDFTSWGRSHESGALALRSGGTETEDDVVEGFGRLNIAEN